MVSNQIYVNIMSYNIAEYVMDVILMAYMMVKNDKFISNRFHEVHQWGV